MIALSFLKGGWEAFCNGNIFAVVNNKHSEFLLSPPFYSIRANAATRKGEAAAAGERRSGRWVAIYVWLVTRRYFGFI